MAVTVPDCPACRVRMVTGFVIEHAQNAQKQLTWTEGPPEKTWRGFTTKDRLQLALVAHRCPRCGWVVWFAPEAGAEE